MAKFIQLNEQIEKLKQKQQEINQIQIGFCEQYQQFLDELSMKLGQQKYLEETGQEITLVRKQELEEFQERMSESQMKFQKYLEERQKQLEEFISKKRIQDKEEILVKMNDLQVFFNKLKEIQNQNSKTLQQLMEKLELSQSETEEEGQQLKSWRGTQTEFQFVEKQ